MSTPYLGQVYLVGYKFAQRGFALCAGQLLPASQYTALFSLLGTAFGGDGRTNFRLPDLQGRVAIGQGTGAGLSPRKLGESDGSERNTLTTQQMPNHSHTATLHAESTAAASSDPTNNLIAQSNIYAVPGRAGNVAMSSESVTLTTAGGSSPVNNMQPFLVMNYEIALQGLFPSRN